MVGQKPSPAKIVPNTMEFPDPRKSSSTPPPEFLEAAPDSHIVFPPKYTNATPQPSSAKAKQKTKGIYSQDPILDTNPNELWRYVVSNLRPPRLAVHLRGTHTESSTSRKAGGGTESDSKTVTDFSIRIDISHLVTQWSQLYAHPAGADIVQFGTDGAVPTAGPTVREAVEEYTSSKGTFKEFKTRKLVLWDYGRVEQELKDLVRASGYRNTIHVDFPMEDYKVVATASNRCSRFAQSTAVRVMCCVSCLCVVFWPAWAMARKRMKNSLTCEYRTRQSAEEFLSRNSFGIRYAVEQRIKGYVLAM